MIELRIGGKKVDLKPNSEINMERTNPYLFYDRLPDSKISVPNMPLTPRNRRVFGYVDLPLVLGGFQQYVYELFYYGQLLKNGFFVLGEAGQGYSGVFTDKGGDFFGDYQSQLLTDIDWGTMAVPSLLPPTIPPQGGNGECVCFPSVVNPDFFGTNGANIGYLGVVNRYTNGAYDMTQPIVPMVSLKWLLGAIAAKTGTTIEGDFLTSEWEDLLLYNTRTLDGASIIKIAQHLPELTVEGLFLELRKLFNLGYTIDGVNKKMTIGFWDEMIATAEVIDWSRKAVKGTTKTPENYKRIQLGSDLDGNDQLMKDKPTEMADYVTAGNEGNLAVMKCKFSTLSSSPTPAPSNVPIMARQVGQSVQFNQLTAKFSPRLIRWRGLLNGVPTATNEGLTWKTPPSPTPNPSPMGWGIIGLGERYWKNSEAMRAQTEYIKQDFLLTEADLATFDFRQKVHVNGVNYFVVNLNVTLPIKKPASVLLMRA